MKTRKLVLLVAITVAAAFVLTGCDAMLESIYPNETNPPETYNSLTVTVYADYSSVGADIWTGPLTIAVYKDGALYTTLTDDLSNYWYGYNLIEYYYTFTNLPSGTYMAYAWIDYNNNGTPTGDYDYGDYWPAVQSDYSSSVYLSGGSSGYLSTTIYSYGYNYWTTLP
jgi:hypothetical protein